jgi:hypothetical protein
MAADKGLHGLELGVADSHKLQGYGKSLQAVLQKLLRNSSGRNG